MGKGFHEKNHPRGIEPDKARLPRQSCLARLTRGTDSIVTQVQKSGSSEDGSVDSEFRGISRREEQTNPTYSTPTLFLFLSLIQAILLDSALPHSMCKQGLARSLSNVHDSNN